MCDDVANFVCSLYFPNDNRGISSWNINIFAGYKSTGVANASNIVDIKQSIIFIMKTYLC